MNRNIVLLFLFVGLLSIRLSSSPNDSLKNVWLDKTKNDTIRLDALEGWIWDNYLFVNPDTAFILAQKEYDYAKQKGIKKYMAGALKTQGASLYLRGIYSKAMEFYGEALKIYEELNNRRGEAACLLNIGNIYSEQKYYDKAIEHYTKGLKIERELGDAKNEATFLNNIGVNYKSKGDFGSAMEYYKISLAIYKKIDNKVGIAYAENNIGNIVQSMGLTEEADAHYRSSYSIYLALGDKKGEAMVLNNLSQIYAKKKEFNSAIKYATKSLEIATAVGLLGIMRDAQFSLYTVYKTEGNSKEALIAYEHYFVFRDSMQNEESRRQVMQQEMQYNYQKQKAVDQKEFEKEKAVSVEKAQQQKLIIYAALIILVVVIVFSFIIYKRWQVVKKQKAFIEKQKGLVEEKQKEILDSIHYAKRIQQSLLPTEKFIDRTIEKAKSSHEKK